MRALHRGWLSPRRRSPKDCDGVAARQPARVAAGGIPASVGGRLLAIMLTGRCGREGLYRYLSRMLLPLDLFLGNLAGHELAASPARRSFSAPGGSSAGTPIGASATCLAIPTIRLNCREYVGRNLYLLLHEAQRHLKTWGEAARVSVYGPSLVFRSVNSTFSVIVLATTWPV